MPEYLLTRFSDELTEIMSGCADVLMHNDTPEHKHENISSVLTSLDLTLGLIRCRTELAAMNAADSDEQVKLFKQVRDIEKLRVRLFSFLHTIDLEMISHLKEEGEHSVEDN